MRKAVSAALVFAVATLATGGIAAGPAFAASPAPATVGQTSASQSDVSFNLPDGQTAQHQVVSADYVYSLSGAGGTTAHTTYHLTNGGSLTVDVTGQTYRGIESEFTVNSGTASYSVGGQTKTYKVTGGDFTIDQDRGKAQETAILDTPDHGIVSYDF